MQPLPMKGLSNNFVNMHNVLNVFPEKEIEKPEIVWDFI